MKKIRYAHSGNKVGCWHPLVEHLQSVSRLAREFAGKSHWAEEANLCGLVHDLGKYADRFQARLLGKDQGLDHWSQGAWLALLKHKAIAAAVAVQGHHVGLQRASKDALRQLDPKTLVHFHPHQLTLSDSDLECLLNRAEADGLIFRTPVRTALSLNRGMALAVSAMLDVRLLFSCLVDADFLDTEAHFEGDSIKSKRHRRKGPSLDAQAALTALEDFLSRQVRSGSSADERVRVVRETLWNAAGASGEMPCGPFTLTAPTGSGKTLAMLRFALKHAAHHGLKRIILAVPFLSIIEQTARVYRKVFAGFPEHFVLEHHSLAGLGAEQTESDNETDEERQRRLLAENWDAPIVLTTNVQLLESLFSNRPSACRKLHSLMESVILFDEAQSLPQHLAVPTLAALSHLSADYQTSVVFATATQPAFQTLDGAVKKHAVKGWCPTETVSNHSEMFAALKRVSVCWPKSTEKLSWAELADELQEADQALVVVNLKRHALALIDAMGKEENLYHLSTNLCTEHRRAVLETVRAQLAEGKPCRLISTQCIEAGVDVDFPVVYRALAPLEAIAQASGRCNREGRMEGVGKVVVFEPEEEGDWHRHYPTFAYFKGAEVTRSQLALHGNLDINDPEVFLEYYRRLYNQSDPSSLCPELEKALIELDFADVARLYRLIKQDAIQVLVPWERRISEFETLRSEAEHVGISADWMRRAQGLTVSIYRPSTENPASSVLIPTKLRRGGTSDEWYILEDRAREYYEETLGLVLPQSDQIFIA